FAISGALAGLGGFMFAARFASVDAIAGRSFEFDVVTAVVIGGVNVFGGSGTVLGASLGALLVATIDNGFTLLRISEFWKIFFEGTALLVAVIIGGGIWSWTLSSFFLRRANLLDLATPYIFIGLLALGLAFVVVAGEIDISVASTMTVSAVSCAQIWAAGANIWVAAL